MPIYVKNERNSPASTDQDHSTANQDIHHVYGMPKGEMVQPGATTAFLWRAKTATMCTVCHHYAHPPPHIPPFYGNCLQNELCQLIKCGQSCTSHQWLKG